MAPIATLTLNPAVDKSSSVPQIVADRKLRCGPPRWHPGGGGINVARAVHQLGGQATAHWTCGGPTGQLLKQLLDDEGIDQVPLQIQAMTRQNLIIYEESSERQYRFGMPGAKLADDELRRCIDGLQDLEPAPEYLVLSGSLPPGAPDDTYARLARAAPPGCRVVLDTSGEPLRRGLEAPVHLVKPNIRELEQLADQPIENDEQIHEIARSLISEGRARVVVISLGAGGVILVGEDEDQQIRAPTVKIRSKVGAGDSSVAGIVLGLVRGLPLADAVRFGVAAGAAAVMTGGTELCRRADAERLFEELAGGR